MSKQIPEFKSEEEEQDFWGQNDVTDYFELSPVKKALFPNLKPTTKTISIRLPEPLLDSLRMIANKRDIPYQSLIKFFLQQQIDQESRNQT